MFHVPEHARISPLDHPLLGSYSDIGNNGAFKVNSVEAGWYLFIICSDGEGGDAIGDVADWEHVSVSAVSLRKTRIPTWREMCAVKGMCWDAEDVVVQYHPKESEYVNVCPFTLHMWRWKKGEFPRPPTIAVG